MLALIHIREILPIIYTLIQIYFYLNSSSSLRYDAITHREISKRFHSPFTLQSSDISGDDLSTHPCSPGVDNSFSCSCSLSHWRILHHCCTFSCSFLHSPRNLRHIPAAELVPPASSPSSPSPSPSSSVTWNRIRSCPEEQK